MNYKQILLIFTALSVSLQANSAGTLKSSVRASIRESIPGSQTRQATQIDYPVTGRLTLSATQFCGDGDVADFAHTRPEWHHQNDGSLKYVFGYWVVGEGESLKPEKGNYFSVGTGEVAVNGPSITKMKPATGGPDVEILSTINSSMGMLAGLRGYRMQGTPNTKDNFKVFIGGMMCKTGFDMADSTHDPIKVSTSFKNFTDSVGVQVENAIRNAADWNAAEQSLTGLVADTGSNSVLISIGTGKPVTLGSGTTATWAKDVYQLAQPTQTVLADYTASLSSNSTLNAIKTFANELDSKETCNQVSGLSGEGKYPWEPFALQLTCAAFNKGAPGSLLAKVNALQNPTAIPSTAEFKNAKEALAAQLAAGALTQKLQQAFLARNAALPKQRCFDGFPYVNTVMASTLFRNSAGAPEYIMSHPEGGFAIFDYEKYYAPATGDVHTIFNMTTPAATPDYGRGLVRGGTSISDSIFVPEKVVIKFNVRGIGCSTNVYCWND